MPAAFIGHGSPMNALEHNEYSDAWRSFGAAIPRPRGVLMLSAHWYISASAVTAMEDPRTIHDFFGFPDELFSFEYPAPGDPALAARVVALAKPSWVGMDQDSWGIDHGAWSVLTHVIPEADVPVVQLSVNSAKTLGWHVEMGARLAPLRAEGVLVLASGNVVHNLHLMDPRLEHSGFDWAERFDGAARAAMTKEPAKVTALERHPDYVLAAPTPDHFLPLLYLAGLADAAESPAEVLLEGCAMGSLSMTSYTVGFSG
jgi:4,5-DOPA dioxygenase extradiol